MATTPKIMRLRDMQAGQLADCFALLAGRERGTTRDGRPFYRVSFRDAVRTVTAMVWHDSAFFDDCEERWQKGRFYKLRCTFLENQYGEQVDLDRVRLVEPSDSQDGFQADEFFPSTRFDVAAMFADLVRLAREHVADGPLRRLVVELLEAHRERLCHIPAAARNHHAFTGGYLEHVLSVTKTSVYLAEKYTAHYPRMNPPLSKPLIVAGAILHDIGKLLELDARPQGTDFTPQGRLIGHILLGRDIVRDKAAEIADLDPELLLRLEHIIVSHQSRPEWGSPIPPHTPEALLVHYADDIDAKFQMMALALDEETTDDDEPAFTSRSNALKRSIFRGLPEINRGNEAH